MPFGERDHLLPGRIARHGGTDDEHRAARGAEQRRRPLEHRGVTAYRGADLARRHGSAGAVPVIHRHRHERGAARRLHGHVEGTRHRRRHVLGPRRLAAPFHVRPRQVGGLFGVQERLERQDRARLLPGRDHERRLVAVRGEDAAERMTDADGRVQVDQRGAAARLREAVGHRHHHGLLQPEHVAEISRKVAEHRQLGGARDCRRWSSGRTRAAGRTRPRGRLRSWLHHPPRGSARKGCRRAAPAASRLGAVSFSASASKAPATARPACMTIGAVRP